MKENSIEEDIILLKDFTEGNFKRDKLENYKGSYKMGYFYYKDIQQAIEHLLSDYKKLQKENEELKNQEATARRINELLVQRYSNSIPVQKVKDKIEELKQERDETYTKFLGGNRTDENLSTRGKMIEGGIKVLQELLEESEE